MMTNELITVNPELPIEITEDQLPQLNLRQADFLRHLLAGNSLTNAYKMAKYDSIEHAGTAAWQLANNPPVKNHIEYHRKRMADAINVNWIMDKYNKIINSALDEDKPHTFDPEIAVKALQELTKIKGMYAPVTTQVNQIHASIEDIRNARDEYKREK